MADTIVSAVLNAAWNGTSPAAAPAGSTLIMSLNNLASVALEITGTFTATVVLEVTTDGTTWFSPNCLNVDKSSGTASLTAAGRRLIQTAGYVALRARCSAFTSGGAVTTFAGSWVAV